MSNIDWGNAPVTATHYGGGRFWRMHDSGNYWESKCAFQWVLSSDNPMAFIDYQERPQAKPPVSAQEAILGQAERLMPVTAAHFLDSGLSILRERGQQYGSNERECSFPQVAEAFNAITGKQLLGSDVCLILALVKQVRQYAQPGRFHEDSAVDGVNYTALQAELLKKERG